MEKSVLNNPVLFKFNKDINNLSKKNAISLCCSIFYEQSKWYSLVKNALLPFIDKNKKLYPFFYLSEYRGPHIRLVLTVEKEAAYKEAKSIDRYFKEYLREEPSNLKIEKNKSPNFFKDFENNSIQYGLFDYTPNTLLGFNLALSELLIFVFQEYENEFHTSLNEIMLQIMIVFCNAIKLSDEDLLKILKKQVDNEYQHYKEEALKDIVVLNEQDFLENRSILVDYLKERRSITKNAYEESWEVEWYDFVHSFFSEIPETEHKEMKIVIAMNKIMEAFNVHNKVSLYYLLKRSIETYNA